jgi:acyl-CoA synthetase (AMP-forming)/AMP-acid ligase II
LRDGEWFATGDIARADEEGFYYLLGRTKAVINVGGMKFFPEEVENLLCSHPGVSDARVMGRVHPTFGSVPVAEIVPTGNPQVSASELTMLCKKQLARYKIPVEMLFVDAIPKTPSGKTLRR